MTGSAPRSRWWERIPFLDWEMLRRIGRDTALERTTLGIMALIGALVAFVKAAPAAQIVPASLFDESRLVWSATLCVSYLVFWYVFQVLVLMRAPSIFLDFHNLQAYLDSFMKVHIHDDIEKREIRSIHIEVWQSETKSRPIWRIMTLFILVICFLFFFASVVLLALSIRPALLQIVL